MTRPLQDRYGRVATDLRVSLTDRCNLRCNYCMPAEGLDWLPTEEVLTDDEVVRLITIGVERLGIAEVRFTGGEPLLRRGLVDIRAVAAGHAHEQRMGDRDVEGGVLGERVAQQAHAGRQRRSAARTSRAARSPERTAPSM